ncbi:unnamed protein product [Closterium sp. Yama58-4]|nr:unnamed protein product [Closterium sp. Yama58-4]
MSTPSAEDTTRSPHTPPAEGTVDDVQGPATPSPPAEAATVAPSTSRARAAQPRKRHTDATPVSATPAAPSPHAEVADVAPRTSRARPGPPQRRATDVAPGPATPAPPSSPAEQAATTSSPAEADDDAPDLDNVVIPDLGKKIPEPPGIEVEDVDSDDEKSDSEDEDSDDDEVARPAEPLTELEEQYIEDESSLREMEEIEAMRIPLEAFDEPAVDITDMMSNTSKRSREDESAKMFANLQQDTTYMAYVNADRECKEWCCAFLKTELTEGFPPDAHLLDQDEVGTFLGRGKGKDWRTAEPDKPWLHGPRTTPLRVETFLRWKSDLTVAKAAEFQRKKEKEREPSQKKRTQKLRDCTVNMYVMSVKALSHLCKVEGVLFGEKALHIIRDITSVSTELKFKVRNKWLKNHK